MGLTDRAKLLVERLVGPAILGALVFFVWGVFHFKQAESVKQKAWHDERARDVAAENAKAEQEAEAAQVERDNQATADIAECSKVVDPLRCQRAFRCWAEPEICVIEHGDPDAVLEIQSRAELYQLIGDRAFDLPAG